MIKSSLLSIDKKTVKWDKKLAIYTNGDSNAYPEFMEGYKNNSITAKMASSIMVQFLLGKGFGEADNILIGKTKLIDLADDIAADIVDNRGVFIHVNYNALYEVSDFKVLPFKDCRIGEKDSSEYNGKILIYKDWSGKVDTSKVKILNVFNPDKATVEYQVNKAGGIENYPGQVFYYNMDSQYYYPLSRIDPVHLECDIEYLASVYKKEVMTNGFFGKTLIVTRPLIDKSFIDDDSPEGLERYRQAQSERDKFKEGVQDFLGVKKAGGVMHFEVDFAGEKLEDSLVIRNIESNIDPSMFTDIENTAMNKILMAYNNIPIALVKSPDAALLGNSGTAIRAAKETYWESTWKERNLLETIINDLLKLVQGENYNYVFIQPLLEPLKPEQNDF